jgi:nucleoside-diphosphate-sugar epimerase
MTLPKVTAAGLQDAAVWAGLVEWHHRSFSDRDAARATIGPLAALSESRTQQGRRTMNCEEPAKATAERHSVAPRTAFVTGATGFLGLNLIRHLTELGWKVIALHRARSNLTYLQRFPVRLVEGEIEDPASLERALPDGVDAVFHVAADVSFWSRNNARQTRTNVDGTRNVVAAALRRGVKKLIHTSTTSVYGFPTEPFDETAPHLGKHSWFNYMRTKTLAEEEVRHGIAHGLDAVLLNPANGIGPYDLNNWSRLIRLAAAGKLSRVPPGRASFCHAAEVARAHVAAVQHGRNGENYILAGADASYAEAVRIIADLLHQPVNVRTAPPFLLRAAGRLLSWTSHVSRKEPLLTPESAAFLSASLLCRSDKAIRELNYRPVPLRTMLEDCHRWLVAEGLLKAA